VNVNDQFIKALPLPTLPNKLEKAGKVLLLDDGRAATKDTVLIPHEKLYGQNQMQLFYFFDYTKQGSCKDVYLHNERGAIDSDSSIDFSAFPHFAALPNLSFFANDGFPYSRMADLSETTIFLPNEASPPEIETYLTLMGRMGKVTGFPATNHALAFASDVEQHADKDLIVIGTSGSQPLLSRWADNMHPILESGSHTLKLPGVFERLLFRWDDIDLEDAMKRAGDLITQGESGLGALVAFESPLKSGRSVVVLTGDTPNQIAELAASMTDSKTAGNFRGDLVLQSGKRIEGFQLGPSYYVGSLPWWTSLRWHLSQQPLVLIVLILLSALLTAVVAFRYLRTKAAERLRR
jgi:cellulose synthase (UDP-forming)